MTHTGEWRWASDAVLEVTVEGDRITFKGREWMVEVAKVVLPHYPGPSTEYGNDAQAFAAWLARRFGGESVATSLTGLRQKGAIH